MIANKSELLGFFRTYGESFDNGMVLAGFYGDCALASTPNFVGCLKGKEEVRTALNQVAEYQVKTGMTSLVPLRVEAMEVDSLHWWVKVYWDARFKKTGEKPILFEVSYLVRRNGNDFSILMYVAHQDEHKMREDLGVS